MKENQAMRINRDNYEAFFLDYLEGTLAPFLHQELLAFLAAHPDLAAELESYEKLTLAPSGEVHFPGRENLKKTEEDHLTDPAEQFEEFVIAYYENDLPVSLRQRLELYLGSHPEKRKEFEVYGQLYLKPDQTIRFQHKNQLKKGLARNLHIPAWVPYLAAAASVAVLIVSYFIFLAPGPVDSVQVAQVDTLQINRNVLPQETTPVEKPSPASNEPAKPSREPQRTNQIPVKTNAPVIQIKMSRQPETQVVRPSETLAQLSPVEKVRIDQEVPLAELREVKTRKVSAPAEDAMTVREYAVYQFKKSVLNEDEQEIRPDRFSLWNLAQAGVKGLNDLTGWDMKMKTEYNEEGKVDYLAFQSRALNITHVPKK